MFALVLCEVLLRPSDDEDAAVVEDLLGDLGLVPTIDRYGWVTLGVPVQSVLSVTHTSTLKSFLSFRWIVL